VKSGWLWAGAPAKPVRTLTEEELAYFPVSALQYSDLAREYGGG
jgi:carbonic anhydrase/acetyltransferase-like protein (isoleucine patch superfamily)